MIPVKWTFPGLQVSFNEELKASNSTITLSYSNPVSFNEELKVAISTAKLLLSFVSFNEELKEKNPIAF